MEKQRETHLHLWNESKLVDRQHLWKREKLKEAVHMLSRNNLLSRTCAGSKFYQKT